MAAIFRVWTMPVLLAVIGFAGLICALVGDGAWDVVSWAALGSLVGVTGWRLLGR